MMVTPALACIPCFEEFRHGFEHLPLPSHLPFIKHAFESLQERIILDVLLLAPMAYFGVGGGEVVVDAVDLKWPILRLASTRAFFNFDPILLHYNLYS